MKSKQKTTRKPRKLTFEQFEARLPLALTPDATLTKIEVNQLLSRAAAASSSQDAIIAIVDRGGRIVGVRAEQDVLNTFASRPDKLYFSIDGAVAKARTAASFANNGAPLTSRTIRNISQSTITEREVNSNPNLRAGTVADTWNLPDLGPGFVAPIGVGGHFPPDIDYTPPVDLFNIEHQGRDGNIHPGLDGLIGNADDIYSIYAGTDGRFGTVDDTPRHPGADGIYGNGDDLPNVVSPRFNFKNPIQGDFLNQIAGDYITYLEAPNSYGYTSGLYPQAQGRGFATLPGGIPLVKSGQVVGGIGVFFPGPDGYASYEQNFKPNLPGQTQTTYDRTNAPRVLEAEWIAYAATGGSSAASAQLGFNARVGTLDGVAPVPNIDLPFGRIDLGGITLELFGPNPTQQNPKSGIATLFSKGQTVNPGLPNSRLSGANQTVGAGTDSALLTRDGKIVPFGWLVNPRTSPLPDGPTATEVVTTILQGVRTADQTRAAIRLPLGARTKMVFAVADKGGNLLGLYRMPDATIFSIDVAVAKARNTAYYANPTLLQPQDKVDDDLLSAALLPTVSTNGAGNPDIYTDATSSTPFNASNGLAFTNRTFRYLVEPRFPAGVEHTTPPVFSILTDEGINVENAETLRNAFGVPVAIPASSFNSVSGFDAFHAGRNFSNPQNIANQNGIVYFPGSTPLYRGSLLIGGFGVSGDGVDQDDVVTAGGLVGLAPPAELRADKVFYRGVRLPFQKFNRNPSA